MFNTDNLKPKSQTLIRSIMQRGAIAEDQLEEIKTQKAEAEKLIQDLTDFVAICTGLIEANETFKSNMSSVMRISHKMSEK